MGGIFQVILIIQCFIAAFTQDLIQPQGCDIFKLGHATEEEWTREEPFRDEIDAAIRSPNKTWHEFSLHFESYKNEAIGSLNFKRNSTITLTLENLDEKSNEYQNESHTIPNDIEDQLQLQDWTIFTLYRFNNSLKVDVNGEFLKTFSRVSIAPFRNIYAYVPGGQYIDIGFGCKKGIVKPVVVEPPRIEIKVNEETTECLSIGNGFTTTTATTTAIVVVLVVLVLIAAIVTFGYFYLRKIEQKAGYLLNFSKKNKHKRAEEGRLMHPEQEEATQLINKKEEMGPTNQEQNTDLGEPELGLGVICIEDETEKGHKIQNSDGNKIGTNEKTLEIEYQIQVNAEDKPIDMHLNQEELCQEVIIRKPGEDEKVVPRRISEIKEEARKEILQMSINNQRHDKPQKEVQEEACQQIFIAKLGENKSSLPRNIEMSSEDNKENPGRSAYDDIVKKNQFKYSSKKKLKNARKEPSNYSLYLTNNES